MTGALVVFAKEPRPGEVKTRLCPPFTPEIAAEFYACMLDDVLEHSASLAAAHGLAPFLYGTPADAVGSLSARAPLAFETRPQRGADLGARMDAAVRELAHEGFGPLVLRGSDSPALAEETFAAALAALERDADVAASPDPDGGYGLIALRCGWGGLFDHPMSTSRVLEETFGRAEARSLRCVRVSPGFDVDTVNDLGCLRRSRERRAPPHCPRTFEFLDSRALWPED